MNRGDEHCVCGHDRDEHDDNPGAINPTYCFACNCDQFEKE